MTDINLEKMLFDYMDQIKLLISPETWGNAVLDCSKNEIFALLLLYRNSEANMTEIAEYIEVPLNTATGVIARMEKRNLVFRQRSAEDKRVVTISLTKDGQKQISSIVGEFFYYGQKLLEVLSSEELLLLNSVFDKLIHILKEENINNRHVKEKRVKKITIQ